MSWPNHAHTAADREHAGREGVALLEDVLRWAFWNPDNGGQWPRIAAEVAARLAAQPVPAPPQEGVAPSGDDLASDGRTAPPPAASSVPVVHGWRTYDDGSRSPVERWVQHADGDWVSLDSTRRTSSDIFMEVD